MKKHLFLFAAILLVSGAIFFTLYPYKNHSNDLDINWSTYTNKTYSYSIKTKEIDGVGILIQDMLVNESDGLDINSNTDYKAFYLTENSILLGTIFCINKNHSESSMSLRDYAQKLYESHFTDKHNPTYEKVISIIDLNKNSFADSEAYSFIIGEQRNFNVDISAYTITEKGTDKCVIFYPISDYTNTYNAKLLEARLQWFNSFKWIK